MKNLSNLIIFTLSIQFVQAQCNFNDAQRQLEYEAMAALFNANPSNTLNGGSFDNQSSEWSDLVSGNSCDVCALPQVFCNPNGYIINLSLGSTNLTNLPSSLGNLIHLNYLTFSNNQINQLPSTLDQLSELIEISALNNTLQEIPASIANISTLQRLDFTNNQITSLPAFDTLSNLQYLFLQNNLISEIPSSIIQLQNLLALNVAQNQIHTFPTELAALPNIQAILFNNNLIECLDSSLSPLCGKFIQIDQNPIATLTTWDNFCADNQTTCLDTDGDNVNDNMDNCPFIYNPGQEDTDMNGVGDVCDMDNADILVVSSGNNPQIVNPNQSDIDADGISDDFDNCISVYNPNQEDADNDGKGDLCDCDCNSDLESPIFSALVNDLTVSCDSIPSAATSFATDNCDTLVQISFSEIDSLNNCAGFITRIWTATDGCNNQSSLIQIITVTDLVAPVLSNVPSNITIDCDLVPAPVNVTAIDNCDSTATVSFNETSTTDSSYTIIQRNWTSIDACGNESNAFQTITVLGNDSDNDGIFSTCDNCPDLANADQLDANGNGVGDACEENCTAITDHFYNNGVDEESNLRELADGAGAEFHDANDYIVVKLEEEVPAGATYNVVWKHRDYEPYGGFTSPAKLIIYESSNGWNYNFNEVLETSEKSDFVSQTVVAKSNAKFLFLKNKYGHADFEIDAIEFCTTPTAIEENNNEGTESEYCTSKGNSTDYEWIEEVELSNLKHVSGNNNGYADFTNKSANVEKGQSYLLKLSPGFSGNSYNEYWKVWADWNMDGDFDDFGELIAYGNSDQTIEQNIAIPTTATNGKTRMRVSMQYGAYPSSCADFNEGEVEDYTLNISGTGQFFALGNFETTQFSAIANKMKVDLDWWNNTGFENEFFEVERSADGENFEVIFEVNNKKEDHSFQHYLGTDELPLEGLNYYRIKTYKVDGTFVYSEVQEINFTTTSAAITIFPNPAQNDLFANMRDYEGKACTFIISDEKGQVLLTKEVSILDKELQHFDLTDFDSGMYFLTAKIDGHKMITKQVIVQKDK